MKLINNLPQKLGIQKQIDTLSQNVLALQAELENIKDQLDALTQPAQPESPESSESSEQPESPEDNL